jgi:RNA polymerase sigma-70 factor (ECF subfamily)
VISVVPTSRFSIKNAEALSQVEVGALLRAWSDSNQHPKHFVGRVDRMSEPSLHAVSQLLEKWKVGDRESLNLLVPLIYSELHSLAHWHLRGERSDHTLQTTALVHEAYIRLAQQGPFQTQDRQHLIAITARLMRQILVDYARAHRADKRGAELKVELNDAIDLSQRRDFDVIALDDALTALSSLDTQQSLIVELRFFGGMTVEETAAVLGISTATANRDWSMAKAWLTRELRRGSHGANAAVGEG